MRILMLAAATALVLSGCTQPYSGGYQSAPVGQALFTETGTVTSSRAVEVTTGGTGLGASIGAVAGSIAGSQIGPSRRFSRRGFRRSSAVSALGAFGGFIVGGLIGAAIENDLSRQVVTEYVVKMDDGSFVTIAQENGSIVTGQRVFLQSSRRGFARLVPVT